MKIGGQARETETKFTPHIRNYISSMIERKVTILIPDIVETEFNKKIWDAICQIIEANINVKAVYLLLTICHK
jgi:hypothetical protein